MQMNQENSAAGAEANVASISASNLNSSLEHRLDLSVRLDEIDKDVQQRLKQISRTVKMAGFRPGKVPMNMVTQQYGQQARSEAIGAAVERVFNDTVRAQNLRVAGQPNVEPKPSSDALLEFSAVFEVYPEIKIGDISSREVEKDVLTVTDAEVDKTLLVLRKQRTTYAEAARPAADEDRVTIDFIGRRDGEPFAGGQANDFVMLLGGGQMLVDFENAVRGMSAGETKTFDMTFPAEYQSKDLAGQTVQFELTVKRVEGPQLPALDAEFAKSLGITDGDLLKMREEVTSNLEREVKKRLQARVKSHVMEAILQAHPIEVPKALVESESHQMAHAALQDLQSRGMSMKEVPIQPSWFTDQASRRVSLGLIIAELVKEMKLFAKPEQVRALIDEFSETYEDPSEVVRWHYSQPQRMAEVEALVLENNVVDWVLTNAKVVEKPISFDELMESKQ